MELIRNLFHGDLKTLDRSFDPESRENMAFNQTEALAEELEKKIPAKYHPLLEEYKTSMLELMDAACEEEYIAGYQLGVRMMVAAWPQASDKASP